VQPPNGGPNGSRIPVDDWQPATAESARTTNPSNQMRNMRFSFRVPSKRPAWPLALVAMAYVAIGQSAQLPISRRERRVLTPASKKKCTAPNSFAADDLLAARISGDAASDR